MTLHCDQMLLSHGPIVETLMRTEGHADGWACWIRHRHLGGLFTDCPTEEYEKLSADELVDVIAVVHYGLFAYRL